MRLETLRKSSYKQASISLISSGLVPQSQAITATSQSPETHLNGINLKAMHCHTYATCTPMPLHHVCVPWRLVMTLPHKVYVGAPHKTCEARPSYQTMEVQAKNFVKQSANMNFVLIQ